MASSQPEVISVTGQEVHCQALVSGPLRSHKGPTKLGVDLGISAFTEVSSRFMFAVGKRY
ncbi:MAG: hypothetical protein R3F37_13545 [Candidatus Competibacteraceae bacterium]